MLNRFLGLTALVAVAFVVGSVSAADPKSGPLVGEKVPGPLHPLNCTGDHAGEKYCLYCENGDNPVAMIFARQMTPELTRLIKRIDEATSKNKGRNMGSFAVLLSDADNLETGMKELAKKEQIQHCILAIDQPEGPDGYDIARETDVAVVLYSNLTVKAIHNLKNAELNDKQIEAIVADLAKILTQ